MIPEKIKEIFKFIDFLDKNKEDYIQKYIPLCNYLKKIKEQQNQLEPNKNFIEKQKFDQLQKIIEKDFETINSNVYLPVTNRLKELNIWSGDQAYSSIWNSNIGVISNFKRNFESEDVFQVLDYKEKYLQFRNETNSDFLSLALIFSSLDEILKELFEFFNISNKNEFEKFESKIIEVDSIEDALKGFKENSKNVRYSIPTKILYSNSAKEKISESPTHIKNEIIMGDKFETKNLSNKNGSINIGKKNTIENSDDSDQKSFEWQKWGIIIATILTIITIVLMIIL
ncbi:hypothetical protein BA195_13780 [Tenacibaculum soleae]|uniref:Uncharacterized protein n=1 Tax=Tenacibaculum soleae TaxID=447689 RepID=A0A1B9XW73_9FLAO|nr:hypothetical protein [Tenacibaculum soleae]OCK41808.1 hypothetical protein BA195_13780 [Tenacibaculum soleae]